MLPTKIINSIIIVLSCLLAIYGGSFLAGLGEDGAYLLGILVFVVLLTQLNNFPAILAFSLWFPFSVPLAAIRGLGPFFFALVFITGRLFFRICMTRELSYVRSFNPVMLACFAWVPIRFLLNPVTKVGSQVEGGSGVSGLNSYYTYVFAGFLVVVLGAVVTTREQVMQTLRWSFRFCIFLGLILIAFAFTPATHDLFVGLGGFDAGDITPGVYRIVILPGFAYFLSGAILCPTLFRLKVYQSVGLFALSMFMVILGGNRSALVAVLMFMMMVLLLRRKFWLLTSFGGIFMLVMIGMVLTLANLQSDKISGLTRVFGVFDSKIDDLSGGNASANWRYDVWNSGIQKIMEAPLTGKGFGNLPKSLDPTATKAGALTSTDYEVTLAQGQAHNGYVNAAYGFGIPFLVGMVGVLLWSMVDHMRLALKRGQEDLELQEFHAFMGGYFFSMTSLLYDSFDLSAFSIWFYVSLGIILTRLTYVRQDKANAYKEQAYAT